MKKTLTSIVTLMLTVALAFVFTGCGSFVPKIQEKNEIDYESKIESFVSSGLNTFELYVGEDHAPTATVWLKGGNGTAWTSDDSVVTVNQYGKVTAVGEGSAYIVITADKRGSMFEVYRYDVFEEAPEADLSNLPTIEGVDFSGEIAQFNETPLNTKTLKVDEAHSPTASVWAQSGGSCYSSDASVVKVSPNGTVTAVGRGTAYVVITAGIGDMFEIYKYIVK